MRLAATARQREHEERTAQRRVLRKLAITAHCAEAFSRLLEARRHADAGPAANARVHADELLALILEVNTLPIIPDGVLKRHSSLPSLIRTAFK